MAQRAKTIRPAGPGLLAPKRIAVLVGALGFGVLAIVLYASGAASGTSVVGSALMTSLAAALAGGVLGFLFGIPRALTADGGPAGGGSPPATGRYAANTNLEQVSDWLTKLLLGATLVQLGAIRNGAARLFDTIAPAFGERSDAPAFAGAMVIYFALVGFLLGWLATRLFLQPALDALDEEVVRKLAEAEVAERAGDRTRAGELRREAAGILASAAPVAERYVELRESGAPSSARTAAMEAVVANARQMARTMGFTADDVRRLFRDGDDGQRISALAFMQGRPDAVDMDTVVEAIEASRSAFEQFQALRVARTMLDSGLGGRDRARLLDTVREAMEGPRRELLDDERRALGRRILSSEERQERQRQ